jgi:hypothetical protein
VFTARLAKDIILLKNSYPRHYLSLLFRYGFFPTIIEGNDNPLEKEQMYLSYGFKDLDQSLRVDYWAVLGVGPTWGDLLPSIALGVNVGVNLK